MATDVKSWTNGGANTERWRAPLAKIHEWIPIDFLLAWADVESGGDIKSTTSLGEKGLSQVLPDEKAIIGLSDEDFDRLATDPAFSLATLVKHAKVYANYAKKVLAAVGAEWHGRDFWKLVKLHHGAFAMPKYAVLAFKKYVGRAPKTWDELMGFATLSHALNTPWNTGDAKLDARLLALIPSVFDNSQKTGERSQLPAYDETQAVAAANLMREFGLMQ